MAVVEWPFFPPFPPPPLFRQENSIETGNHRVFGVLNAKRSRLRRVKITENIFPYREMLEGVVYLARAHCLCKANQGTWGKSNI